jgi:hypothetical protein
LIPVPPTGKHPNPDGCREPGLTAVPISCEESRMSAPAPQELQLLVAAARRVARFMESRAEADLAGTFAASGVVIVENFAPFVFEGPDAVERWAAGFRAHVAGVEGLRHGFDEPFEAVVAGDRAYLSLPTTWTGVERGREFTESGGWAFVLVREGETWRVAGYGWAPTTRIDAGVSPLPGLS